MTLLVRDEADIPASTLSITWPRAWISSSSPTTVGGCHPRHPAVLRRTGACGGDPGAVEYAQAQWVTRMAQRAAALGADWVIHADADEFWMAAGLGSVCARWCGDCQSQPVLEAALNAALSRMSVWIASIQWRSASMTATSHSVGKPLPPSCCTAAARRCRSVHHFLTWPDPDVRPQPMPISIHCPCGGLYEARFVGRPVLCSEGPASADGGDWRKDYLSGDLRQRWARTSCQRRSCGVAWSAAAIDGPNPIKRPPAPRGDLSRR